MRKVSRSQLNVNSLKVNLKDLVEEIKKSLENYNYDTDDSAYKYYGKPEDIDEVQFNIIGEKNIDNYSKFKIEVEINLRNAKPVVERGKKLMTGKGKIILRCDILLDYDKKWVKDPFLHMMKNIYEKYIYKGILEGYEKKIALEMFNIRDDIKSFLKIV